jgi:hypothetical protein
MKKFVKFLCAASCVAMLASCSKKVDFAAFKKAASEDVAANVYKTCKVSGTSASTSSDGKSSHKIDVSLTLTAGTWVASETSKLLDADTILMSSMVNVLTVSAAAAVEDTTATYYVKGFKKVSKSDDGTTTITWNNCGLVTSYNGVYKSKSDSSKTNVKFSYSK